MERKRVVIIDDDRIALRPYSMELEISGIDVIWIDNADDGYEHALENKADLYVLDVMLATRIEGLSRYTRNNTMDYLFTGCVLARELRESGINTPIIFFSQTSQRSSIEEIQRQAKEIGNCAFLKKSDMVDLFDFRNIVSSVLDNGLENASKRNWFAWMYKSVLLQPNVAGIGVDVKVIANGPESTLKKS